jgi:hypothetical protein
VPRTLTDAQVEPFVKAVLAHPRRKYPMQDLLKDEVGGTSILTKHHGIIIIMIAAITCKYFELCK